MFRLFRKLLWFGTGASLGFGGAMWIRNRILRAVDRVMPRRIRRSVETQARGVGSTLAAAMSEGRDAMRDRERELRRNFAPGRREAPPTRS
jgi:hypothetical protein